VRGAIAREVKKCENANFGDELLNVKGDTGEN
jgi:hypothetical protein